MNIKYGDASLWGDILIHEGMLEKIMNIHSIQLSSVDFTSIIRIKPDYFVAVETRIY